MNRSSRTLLLLVYYAVASRLPTQPMPGWRAGYALRRFLCARLLAECGPNLLVKKGCYFGGGDRLHVGANSQLGANARIDPEVYIGDNVVMAPDVVIETISHAFDDMSIPINRQGALPAAAVHIGSDVWIGTRVIIMPGVTVGDGCVIGANSVVTRDIPAGVIAVGVPCRPIRTRGEIIASTSAGPGRPTIR